MEYVFCNLAKMWLLKEKDIRLRCATGPVGVGFGGALGVSPARGGLIYASGWGGLGRVLLAVVAGDRVQVQGPVGGQVCRAKGLHKFIQSTRYKPEF